MYKYFKICKDAGIQLYYTDTDSGIFCRPHHVPLPLPIGGAYGEFKYEIEDDIHGFFSLGPKNYCLLLKDKNENMTQVVKARGFFLKDKWASNEVNADTFQIFLRNFIVDKKSSRRLVPQFHIRCEKRTKNIFTELGLKIFRNDTFNKRVAFTGASASSLTLPYGYDHSMILDVSKNSVRSDDFTNVNGPVNKNA